MTISASVTKELNQHPVHKKRTQMVMTYTDSNGERTAKILNMWETNAQDLIVRTIRWASHNGVEVNFRPL